MNSSDIKEKVSALVDGELAIQDHDRVLGLLENDPELRRTWERYHLISAALHDDLAGDALPGIGDRISERLRDEPTVLRPRGRRASASRKAMQWAGGMAIAASVAAVAIVGLRLVSPLEQNTASQIAANTVSAVKESDFIRVGQTHWNTERPELERTLNMYLVEHNEFSPTSSIKGMMVYGRIAGYDTDR